MSFQQGLSDHLHDLRLINTNFEILEDPRDKHRQREREREREGGSKSEKMGKRAKHANIEPLKPQTGSFSLQ